MPLPTVLILTLVLFVFALGLALGRRLPIGFRDRACQGRTWRREYPKATKAQIRTFLHVFVEAFGFDKTDSLRFSPHDSILTVYRALYPSQWTPDSLEFETWALMLEKRYGHNLSDLWNDQLTLGELFRAIEAPTPR